MTRKKFVKQLMSRGYSRNEANAEAQAYAELGIPYSLAIENTDGLQAMIDGIFAAFAKAAEAIGNFVAETLPAIAEAIANVSTEAIAAARSLIETKEQEATE